VEENKQEGNKLFNYLKRNVSRANLIGMIVGAIGGILYYYNVSCKSGACGLTGNPYLMTLWGTAVGYLAGDFFNKKKA